jgi:hypothetical protein
MLPSLLANANNQLKPGIICDEISPSGRVALLTLQLILYTNDPGEYWGSKWGQTVFGLHAELAVSKFRYQLSLVRTVGHTSLASD